jgi:hypothetical protein
MKIYNQYILSLTIVFMLTVVGLIFYNQTKLDLYLSILIGEYMITTILFNNLQPNSRKALNSVGFVLFIGFLALLTVNSIRILTQSVSIQ